MERIEIEFDRYPAIVKEVYDIFTDAEKRFCETEEDKIQFNLAYFNLAYCIILAALYNYDQGTFTEEQLIKAFKQFKSNITKP